MICFSCNNVKTNGLSESEIDKKVSELIELMTLDEKVGQMTQIDQRFLDTITDLSTYSIGSLLSGGGSHPSVNKPQAWLDMYNNYQKETLKSRLQIPLIYGIDAVHGHNNVYGATIFPQNIVSDTIIHEVERKETLFSISQKYKVNINDILELNPKLRESRLKRKSKILIPVFKSIKESILVKKDSLIKDDNLSRLDSIFVKKRKLKSVNVSIGLRVEMGPKILPKKLLKFAKITKINLIFCIITILNSGTR